MRQRLVASWTALVVASGCHAPVERMALSEGPIGWMEEVFDGRPDIRVGNILFPGTHDSASYGCAVENGISPSAGSLLGGLWDLPGADDGGPSRQMVVDWARTQDRTVREQLVDGIRSLDLRVTSRDGELLTWHSVYSVPLDVVLDDVVAFAVENPLELVYLGFGLDLDLGDWPAFADALLEPRQDGVSACDLIFDEEKGVATVPIGHVYRTGRNLIYGAGGALQAYLVKRGCGQSNVEVDGYWSRTISPLGVEAVLAVTVPNRTPGRFLVNDFIFSLEGTSSLIEQGTIVTGHGSLRAATEDLGFSGDFPGRMIRTYDIEKRMNVFGGDFYELTDLIPTAIEANRRRAAL